MANTYPPFAAAAAANTRSQGDHAAPADMAADWIERNQRPKTVACEIHVVADKGFDQALVHLKEGGRVTRHAWGSSHCYVEKESGNPFDDKLGSGAYFVRREKDGVFRPYFPSTEDLLAEDWAHIPACS